MASVTASVAGHTFEPVLFEAPAEEGIHIDYQPSVRQTLRDAWRTRRLVGESR